MSREARAQKAKNTLNPPNARCKGDRWDMLSRQVSPPDDQGGAGAGWPNWDAFLRLVLSPGDCFASIITVLWYSLAGLC